MGRQPGVDGGATWLSLDARMGGLGRRKNLLQPCRAKTTQSRARSKMLRPMETIVMEMVSTPVQAVTT